MSLTNSTGPFAPNPSADIHRAEDGKVLIFEPTPKRVRVRFGNKTIADSCQAKMLHETGQPAAYYFPESDVDQEVLGASGELEDALKGRGVQLDICVGEKSARAAARRWDEPAAGAEFLQGHITFDFAAMDAWFEEDEHVGVHPRDPYHRVDVLRSSRHVRWLVGDTLIAETRRPSLLVETSLAPRFYVPREDVRQQFLVSSTTLTQCPYKGEANYWSVEVDGKRHEDLVWGYLKPLPEAAKVAGMMCVLQEQDGVRVEIDGEVL